jgi:hypothetical protein
MCACVKFFAQVMECLEKVMDIQAEKAFLKASPEAQRKWLLLQDGYAPLQRRRSARTLAPCTYRPRAGGGERASERE